MRKHAPIPKSDRPTGFEHMPYHELLASHRNYSECISVGGIRNSGSKRDAMLLADLTEEIRRREERGDTEMPPQTMLLKLGGEAAEVRVR